MSEAPIAVIENAPVETPPANTPEARTPEGQIKPVTSQSTVTTPTPQTPTDTTKGEEGKTLLNEKPKDQPLVGAPEKYEDFKAPEGYEFKSETMDGARTLFKDLNLSQAGAQKLIDFYTAEVKDVMEAPQKAWEETRTKWLEEVKSDPEIGGKLDQVKTTVAKAIDGLGDTKLAFDFRQAMDFTGAGNNPAFIRAFYKLAQKLTEGTSVPGGGPSEVRAPNQPPRSAAHVLYPNLK